MRAKWSVLALLCAIFVVYTVDRALIGLLALPIQEETGLSNLRFGVLSSASSGPMRSSRRSRAWRETAWTVRSSSARR